MSMISVSTSSTCADRTKDLTHSVTHASELDENGKETRMIKARIYLMALMVALLGLSGMVASAGPVSAQDSTPADQQTFPVNIRFVNAMTSLNEIDVYINGDDSDQRVVEGLEYGTVSEPFEGTAPVTGVLIKQNVNAGFDRYIFDTIVPTEAGKEYLVVVSDLIVIPTELDLSPLGAGMARVRAVHAAAQAPSLDFYVSATGDGASLTDLVPIVTDIRYGLVTDGGEVAAGTFDVRGTATGTDTVAVEASGLALDAGQVYAIVVIGSPGDTDDPLTLLPVAVSATT
jgi:hypothetical protein